MNTNSQLTVIEANQLQAEHLKGVATGDIAAVRIASFYPAELCAVVAARLLDSPALGQYLNAPEIARVGAALYESNGRQVLRNQYFQNAAAVMMQMRILAQPYLSPFDYFRLILDEVWPNGASLATISGHKAFAGIARVFRAPHGAMPHQDILLRDASEDTYASSLIGQIAMNVHLQEADGGGEIELWSWMPTDKEHEHLRHSEQRYAYGVDPSLIRPCDLTLKPARGELILFNPWNVHAVRPVQRGARVTWACFIGYTGNDQPLRYWS